MNENNNYYYLEHIPKSNVLRIQHWVELHLKSAGIFKNKPSLLYSAANDGTSFSVIVNKVVGYTGPWLIVVSHVEKTILE